MNFEIFMLGLFSRICETRQQNIFLLFDPPYTYATEFRKKNKGFIW